MHNARIGIIMLLAYCNVINGSTYPIARLIITAWHPTTRTKRTFFVNVTVIKVGCKTIERFHV